LDTVGEHLLQPPTETLSSPDRVALFSHDIKEFLDIRWFDLRNKKGTKGFTCFGRVAT
jgi:hypothetical protein